MYARDYRDIISGCILIVIGAAVAFHATASLGLGTLLRLGPGGFPAALGVILVLFGLALLIPAFGRGGGELPTVKLGPLFAVLASIVAFGLMLRSLGMAPAVVVMTLIAARADKRLSLPKAAALAVMLAILATLIFSIGLGIRVPIFAWDW